MGSSNINTYEYEGFIDADEENEFNFYFQHNEYEEHEEHEVEVLNEDLEVIDSRRQSTTSRRNNNNNQNDSNPFPPPPSFFPLVHTHSLHDAIVKLPHELRLLSNLTPISIFMLFFTDEIFNQLVENTNSYAIEKGAGTGRGWYPLTIPELKIWIALLIYMGLFKFPSVCDYWNSDDRFPKHKITRHMSLYRFQQVIFLHVCF
jgi:hypothetical protein